MSTQSARSVVVVMVALFACACDRRNVGDVRPAADSTANNKDHDRTKTPIDQSEAASDIRITADVRRAVVADKSMSTNAQNCKIVTSRGDVTLRGVVETQAEKDAVAAMAAAVSGVVKVSNQLEVKKA